MFSRLLFLIASLLIALLSAPATLAATILVYGDSLSAGYGLSRKEDWAHLLELRLREKKLDYTVVNASISGETTLGGLKRMDDTLRAHRPAIVILALGANDGLRGGDLSAMRSNLEHMIDTALRSKSKIILVGMRIPPNYGRSYTEKFHATFNDVAKKKRISLIPFLLDGFADKRDYFQADNLHPAAIAQPLMLDTIWKSLVPLIK